MAYQQCRTCKHDGPNGCKRLAKDSQDKSCAYDRVGEKRDHYVKRKIDIESDLVDTFNKNKRIGPGRALLRSMEEL